MEFKEYRLEEICSTVTDYVANGSFASLSENVKYLKEKSFARLIRLVDYNSNYSLKDSVWVDEGSYNFLKKTKLFGGEIIVSNVGANLGTIFKIPDLTYPMTLGPNSVLLNANEKCNQNYLYYFLKSKIGFQKLMSIVGGSAMPKFNKTDLRKIIISLPSLETQNKIAKILSDIDKKIELNNQINDNLQELMNVNYQEYIRKAEDYVSIPIKDILDFETGVEPGSKSYSSIQLNDYIKFYRVGDMNTDCNNYIPRELAKGKIAEKDDVLVSFDATIGRIAYGIYGAFSSGMKNIKPKHEYENIITNGLIYTYFNDSNTQDVLIQNAIGTTILHASGSINNLYLKFDKEKIKKLSLELELMFSKMKQIKAENQILTQLRDTLLPKLMNGEIDLENIKI
ncbi:MAG TPA: hypothetical protein GX708_00980 [Gallicola sp.]|nr:hypothetical protein [Gallicola sp.]